MGSRTRVLAGLGGCAGLTASLWIPELDWWWAAAIGLLGLALGLLLAGYLARRSREQARLQRRLDIMSENITHSSSHRPIVSGDEPPTQAVYKTPPPGAQLPRPKRT
jgi:hypothetical protein